MTAAHTTTRSNAPTFVAVSLIEQGLAAHA
jgi:hypothetical protein